MIQLCILSNQFYIYFTYGVNIIAEEDPNKNQNV